LGCPLGCKGWVRVETTSYGVIEGAKIEYETLAMLGSNLLIDDLEALCKANGLCNRYGLDTIGVGATIAFAMECYERGIITKEDTGGVELTWGNADAMIAMVVEMGRRQGFGKVLADGSKLAAERLGRGSEKWAIHIGGQDIPAHDPRVTVGFGWGYVCDATPGRHTASLVKQNHDGGIPFVTSCELGFPKLDSLDLDANACIYATCNDFDRLWTSAGLCLFALVPETLPLTEVISAVTGWDFTLAEGLKAGRRIATLRQAFNIREGVKTSEWRLPERLEAAPAAGPAMGRKVDFRAMKTKGYAALGWDARSGKPLGSTLEQLGLKELVGKFP